ncbi:MAG TPA: metal ABC transporter substrate-binding protein [Actinomycetes bacterium]|nr:metal ABC transporter substrate-binding protein [Actinomycetes bacterium]
MRRLLIVLGAACVAAVLAGCGGSPAGGSSGASGDKTLNVVATTTQVHDFTRVIGGDRIKLTGILKPNVDPHDFEPSPADVDAIARADILVKNGVDLEHWLDDTIGSAGFKGATVDTSKGVQIRQGSAAEEDPAGDPHIWQNPRNAKIMVADIEQALASADPANASYFKANQDAYDAKLDALDAEVARQIDSLANKQLVTNHDAFGYYIDRYHLELVGSIIPGFDTSAELSAKDVSDIVAKIKATRVKAIFSESSLPPKTAETIANEAHVKVVEGENALYGDTLGPGGSDGATYLQMIEHNTRAIVSNLAST